MGLWLSVRREVTGVLRSMRYDVDRQVVVYRSAKLAAAETAELNRPYLRHVRPTAQARQPEPRQPRRILATTGVAVLVAGGAAGTYLAVAGGLTALTSEPASPAVAAPASASVAAPSARSSAPARAVREPVRERRRPAQGPVLAGPGPEVTGPAPRLPESTWTTSPTPSPSESASPSPSAASPSPSAAQPSPSRSRYGSPEYDRTVVERAASGQSDVGR